MGQQHDGSIQKALDYFDMDAIFQESYLAKDGSAYRAYFNTADQSINLSELAFKKTIDSKASFDLLNSAYHKEFWHKTRWLSGRFFADPGDNWPQPFSGWLKAEDGLGFAFQRKNMGAWPSLEGQNSTWLGFRTNISQASNFARQYFYGDYHKLFYHRGFKEFLQTIPRRFRTILTYNP